jgi:hypothetical protein
MTFDFHPEAEEEFIEAASFYDKVEPSLGEEFALEVLAALRQRPVLSKRMADSGRRCEALPCQPISIWRSLQRRTRPGLCSRSDAPAPATGLLEGQALGQFRGHRPRVTGQRISECRLGPAGRAIPRSESRMTIQVRMTQCQNSMPTENCYLRRSWRSRPACTPARVTSYQLAVCSSRKRTAPRENAERRTCGHVRLRQPGSFARVLQP